MEMRFSNKVFIVSLGGITLRVGRSAIETSSKRNIDTFSPLAIVGLTLHPITWDSGTTENCKVSIMSRVTTRLRDHLNFSPKPHPILNGNFIIVWNSDPHFDHQTN